MSKNKPQKRRAHQPHGQANSQTAGYGASASANSGSGSASAAATHNPNRTRGALVTGAIVLIILHGALFALLAWSDLQGNGVEERSLYMPILMITSALDVIAGIALWFWKRWGFQLYVGATLVMATSALMNTGSLLVLFASILPTIIVAYIFLPKQKYFD